jgi:hypothetical protein
LTPNGRLEKKREPVSDINTAVVDSLKVLDPKRPIREADITAFSKGCEVGSALPALANLRLLFDGNRCQAGAIANLTLLHRKSRVAMNSRPGRSVVVGVIAACALVVWADAVSAAACVLTAADFEALKTSRSGLASQEQINAKPPHQQTMLCATRLHWNRVASGTWVDSDLDEISPHYLSLSERTAFAKIFDASAQAKLNKMSDVEWRQPRQKLIDELKK